MDTLRDFVILPFTIGKTRERNEQSIYQDGTTSTFVLALFALPFAFFFIENPNGLSISDSKVNKALLGSILLLGTFACIAISAVTYKRGINVMADETIKSTYVKAYCLWLFGIPSMTYYGLKAFKLVHCNYISDNTQHDFSLNVFFLIATVSFTVVEMMFISYFYSYKFRPSILTSYALFLLMIGNLSMWFHSIHSDHKDHQQAMVSNHSSTIDENCYVNSTISDFIGKLRPFLTPVCLENFLLTVTLAKDILLPEECRQTQIIQNDSSVESVNGDDVVGSQTLTNEPPYSSHDRNLNPLPKQIPLRFFIALILVLIAGSVCFAGYLIEVIYLPQNASVHLTVRVAQLYVKLQLLGFTLYGFIRLSEETTLPNYYNPLSCHEYVFLFTVVGSFVMHFALFFDSVYVNDNYKVIQHLVELIQDYLQTIFIIHTSRCKPRACRGTKKNLKWICVVLVVINLGSWFIDSFFLFQFPYINVTRTKNTTQFRKYLLISDIIRPMSIYYRFISGFSLYSISQKF